MKNTKWTWKNGRLWHPTEAMSLSTSEAYEAQAKNSDIARACDGVIKPIGPYVLPNNVAIIGSLRLEREAREERNGK